MKLHGCIVGLLCFICCVLLCVYLCLCVCVCVQGGGLTHSWLFSRANFQPESGR
uniref:Uncharacterized protein n=1 Tax=Sparus aurata TaxID=8175 RepID=A0A671XNQ3_SPAAU